MSIEEDQAFYSDADIELMQADADAYEAAAETCWSCRRMYESTTFYVSADQRTEVYECTCGHRSVWINGRRMS